MNSDNLILRETTFPPLVNKNDFLNSAEFDANFIIIYEDLVALCSTTGVIEFDEATTYDDSINQFASFNGRLYRWIDTAPGSGITPGTEEASAYWSEIFPTDLAHRKNSDEFLAEGTIYEVSARDIRAFIDAGLTTTTDLSITELTGTSFKLNSSTGADVVIPAATTSEAGLMTASDKLKVQRLSGTNTGDQTLDSLGAEAVENKAIDFSTLNDTLYPSVQATETRIGERIDELKGAPPAELDTLEKMASAIANPTRMTTIGKNTTGATLRKGTVVYINGASGGVPTFAKAKADSETTSSRTLGVILADITNTSEGYAVTLGDVDSLDTRTTATYPFTSDTLAVGDQLYLSPTTAGYITNVKPTAPNHLVYIGKVLNTGTTDGEILYQIQNGYELEELHNVKSGATDGQYLKYVASSGLWEPTTLSTGITIGTTPITSGTDTRILFQNGGKVSESAKFTFDGTLLTLDGVTSTANASIFEVKGVGDQRGLRVWQDNSARIGGNTNCFITKGVGSGGATNNFYSSDSHFCFGGIDTTKGWVHIGANDNNPQAKLDIRAQGALSTDIVQRWRNSANSANLGKITGDGAFTIGTYTDANSQLTITGSKNIMLDIEGGSYGASINHAIQGANSTSLSVGSRLGSWAPAGTVAHGVFINCDSGNTSTIHYGVRSATSGAGANYAGYFDAVGGTTNYALFVQRGKVNLGTLPTSSAGLSAGDIWNDSGTLKVV
jgi:hypothetical protein